MNPEPLDLIAALVALIALFTSKEIAQAIGPYAAIFVAACAGAAISISGNAKEMSAWEATWYVTARVLMAVVLTVTIAYIVKMKAGWDVRHTVIPIAFVIGWIRNYELLREKLMKRITRGK